MIPVWEHFEDLEEILYVADVETYELDVPEPVRPLRI